MDRSEINMSSVASNTRSQIRPGRIYQLKRARSFAKGIVTRIRNELKLLMQDNGNVDRIRKRVLDLEHALKRFQDAHNQYHTLLISEDDLQESFEYFTKEERKVAQMTETIEQWIMSAQSKLEQSLLLQELRPDDSVSNFSSVASKSTKLSKGSRSITSRTSKASSSTSAVKLRASAKKAALSAEIAKLKRRQAIQREELFLKTKLERDRLEHEEAKLCLEQQKEELLLETEIAKAEAEERVYFEAECQDVKNLPTFAQQPMSQRPGVATVHVNKSENAPKLHPLKGENLSVNGTEVPSKFQGGEQLLSAKTTAASPLDPKATEWLPERANKISEEPNVYSKLCQQDHNDEVVRQIVNVQHQQSQQVKELLVQQREQTMALTLPQPQVPVFSGDPIDYCNFERAFESLIETKTSSESARLYYLIQYTSGEVQDLMRSCLAMHPDEGYKTARQLLKSRYGENYKIAVAYINRVTNASPIKAEDGPALQRYSVLLTSCKNTLKEIGYINKIENSDALQRIIERLPFGLRRQWRDVADGITETEKREVTVEDVTNFVERKARAANHPIFGKIVSKNDNKENPKPPRSRNSSSYYTHGQGSRDELISRQEDSNHERKSPKPITCQVCSGSHWMSSCEVFKQKSVAERLSFVRAKGLCDNCFQSGHLARNCPRESYCKVADCKVKRKHSTYLHMNVDQSTRGKENTKTSNASTDKRVEESRVSSEGPGNVVKNGAVCGSTGAGMMVVGLSIVPVRVKAKGKDKFIETYAFLDPGSNTSFCTEQLINRLEVTGKETILSLTTMDNENVKSKSSVVSLEVSDIQGRNVIDLPTVFSRAKLPVATEDIPSQSDVDRWPYLRGIHLPRIDADIDLLIGNDVPRALEPKEIRESENGGPYAMRTLLGWTINGPLGRNGNTNRTANRVRADIELNAQFNKFCEMEFNDVKGETDKTMSQEDKRALNLMEQSINLSDGHYEISLPWRVFPPDLPNNKSMAEKRLAPLKKKLVNNPDLHGKYSAFMDNLLEKGYARRMTEEQLNNEAERAWYLPHHSVAHPQKPDKVRIVFDCAAKFQGKSLNEQLLRGPDLTNSLVGVLTRFREETTAVMADVESMFYQVQVPSRDSNYLRFLWWTDGDLSRPAEEFQMCVHLFGGVSSPSCASFALRRTADDNREDFDEETVKTVEKNFYVDDCLKSAKSDSKAIELVQQLRCLLSKGGFHLTKWISNSRQVIESIPEAERAGSIRQLDLDHLPIERVLGVHWNVESDVFGFRIVVKDRPATRRGLLSVISAVYDPLGFLSPFLLTAKGILQGLSRKGLDWDDLIPEKDQERWRAWLEQLSTLQQFTVDRCLKPKNFGPVMSSQLHNFADASEHGYGAVSYLRVTNKDGDVHCAFVMSKSRLAPLKTVTIPRLELSAAVVATRLNRMIQRELDMKIDDTFFWTDSTCVLCYVANQDRRFKTFVANRIATIHDGSQLSQWKHVDTSSNPADDASRGLSAEALVCSKRWIHGPDFLRKGEEEWPKQREVEEVRDDDLEVRRVKTLSVINTDACNQVDQILQHFSSWYRLKKCIAWILRYRSKLLLASRRRKDGQDVTFSGNKINSLSAEEMNSAEVEILKYVQRQSLGEEISSLEGREGLRDEEKPLRGRRRKTSYVKKSSFIYKLDPILKDGLLRVGGRLKRASIQDEAKHPVILPKQHHVIDLIVSHYHTRSGHSGLEYVLSMIRERFWIIKARVAVRKVIGRCFDCKRRQGPAGVQKMADLPEDRVTPDKPPFTFVGVDCFGPFEVRRARSVVKRYGVLYTCLAIRAIHIEVIHSMDTDSFLNSIRRFIARRGYPEVMRSDNGTNFVSGNKELRQSISEWNEKQVQEFMLQRNIIWKFNPPSGSHHGGVWERCVRTVRKVLNAVMKEQVIDDEGLSTLMCEVEAIVNGRPITKSSDDPNDFEALTPNHLLLLRSGSSLPPGVFKSDDTYSRRRWRQVQYLADLFWRRWIKEYLPSLQERQKWLNPSRNFSVNDIVLIVDSRVPRSTWSLGRVIDVRKGRQDKYVRSVTVKTQHSVLDRPIDKLVLLEAADTS